MHCCRSESPLCLSANAPVVQVIADKHAQEKSNATAIICKFFLEAVEKKQYGWCGPVSDPQ